MFDHIHAGGRREGVKSLIWHYCAWAGLKNSIWVVEILSMGCIFDVTFCQFSWLPFLKVSH